MNATDSQLVDWIRRTASGDDAAFESLYLHTVSRVLARVRRITGDFFAEDVLTEVYLQVWKQAASFDPARGDPMAWIATIARSRALDRYRQEHKLWAGHLAAADAGDPVEPWHDDTPESRACTRQMQDDLHGLLRELSPPERMVLGLAYFREHTQSEIAALLRMPLGTVKTHMHRSQRKLRQHFLPATATNEPDVEGTA